MSETFVVGDVVQLKSGGESMTVEEIDGDDVSCVWFEGKRLQRQTFGAGTLKKYIRPAVGVKVSRA
ncbi:MAG: DUF2158 domain-containing protein [Planctomycetota bacterium]